MKSDTVAVDSVGVEVPISEQGSSELGEEEETEPTECDRLVCVIRPAFGTGDCSGTVYNGLQF